MTGMKEWNESVLEQDFGGSISTVPDNLNNCNKPTGQEVFAVATQRTFNLVITGNDTELIYQNCVVTEFDVDTGWEKWDDSVFIQDFEDSIDTVPANL
jgi:hypothetical protein